MSYANIAEEKELAKLMLENRNMTDFMPLIASVLKLHPLSSSCSNHTRYQTILCVAHTVERNYICIQQQ